MRIIIIVLLLLIYANCFGQFAWEEPVSLFSQTNYTVGNLVRTGNSVFFPFMTTGANGEYDIYLHKVNSSGNLVWPNGLVADNKPGNQCEASLISTTDGYLILVWKDTSQDLAGDIYIQKFDEEGQPLWTEGGIPLCNTTAGQSDPRIVSDNTGGAYIVWQDERDNGEDIYGAHLNNTGENLWDVNGILISTCNFNQVKSLVCLSDNSLVLGIHGAENSEYSVQTVNELRKITTETVQTVCQIADSTGAFIINEICLLSSENLAVSFKTENSNNSLNSSKIICFTPALDSLWSSNITGTDLSMFAQENNELIVQYKVWSYYPTWNAQKYSSSGTICWDSYGAVLQGFNPEYDGWINWQGCLVTKINGDYQISYSQVSVLGLSPCTTKLRTIKVTEQGIVVGSFLNTSEFGNPKSVIVLNEKVFALYIDERAPHNSWLTSYNVNFLQQINQINLSNTNEINNIEDYYFVPGSPGCEVFYEDRANSANRHSNKYYLQKLSSTGNMTYPSPGYLLYSDTGYKHNTYEFHKTPDNYYSFSNYSLYDYPYSYQMFEYKNWLFNQELVQTDSLSLSDMPDSSYFGNFTMIRGRDYSWLSYRLGNSTYLNRTDASQFLWTINTRILFSYGTLLNLSDGYYIGERNLDTRYLFINRFNELGNPIAEWPQAGIVLDSLSANTDSNIRTLTVPLDQGYFVLWQTTTNSVNSIKAKCIDKATGIELWSNADFLSGSISDIKITEIDSVSFLLSYIKDEGGGENLVASKYLWNGSSIEVDPDYSEMNVISATEIGEYCLMQSGSRFIYAWQQYQNRYEKVFLKAITTLDETLPYPDGLNLSNLDGDQHSVKFTKDSRGFIYISWLRSLPEVNKNQLLAMRLNPIDFVANSNNEVPVTNFTLSQNYPNPFNPETTISFSIPIDGKVELAIYNIKGQKVKTLINENKLQGRHTVVWNGRNETGKMAASGIYFYKLTSVGRTQVKKMLLMK